MKVCETRENTTFLTKGAERKGMVHTNDGSEVRHYMPHTEEQEGWGSGSAGNACPGYEILARFPSWHKACSLTLG